MPARLSASDVADVGDTWRGVLLVTDVDGTSASADTVTVVVVEPSGATLAGTATEQDTPGEYIVEYDVAVSGLHIIIITAASTTFGTDVLTMSIHVRATTGTIPDMSAVMAYLGDTSYTAEEISDALAAEQAAQTHACTIPAEYPADLAQALKRRVARNLAARDVPVASFTSFEGGGTSARVPKIDAEIARFEGPWRKWPVA